VIIGTIKGRLGSAAEGRQAAYRHVVDSLRCCLEEAERCGVQLCVEAINRYEADFLNTAAEAVSFIEQFGSKQVGLLLDTFHMNIEEACLMGPIRQYAEYLFHVHLADSNRLAPGWGHLDFPSLLRELSAAGYRGSLGLEYLPLPSPEESAGQGVTYLRRLPQG
jgi:sugar phosphate isomerase/epimerase